MNSSVTDGGGNAITNATPSGVIETYTFDNTGPSLLSITRKGVSPTDNDTFVFDVAFDQALDASSVDVADFDVSGTSASAKLVSVVGATATVTVSGGDLAGFTGTVGLSLASGQDITDAASNVMTTTTPSGANETFVLDNAGPTVTSVRPTPTRTALNLAPPRQPMSTCSTKALRG